jgi:hypothetical protein
MPTVFGSRAYFDRDHLGVELVDGRTLRVPIEWYPRLANGTAAERNNWSFLADGEALEWPDLDEHISVAGLLSGKRSGESAASLERWLRGRDVR